MSVDVVLSVTFACIIRMVYGRFTNKKNYSTLAGTEAHKNCIIQFLMRARGRGISTNELS